MGRVVQRHRSMVLSGDNATEIASSAGGGSSWRAFSPLRLARRRVFSNETLSPPSARTGRLESLTQGGVVAIVVLIPGVVIVS